MRIERNKENGLVVIAAIIIIVLFTLSLLVSCRTTKTTAEIYVHDTVHVYKSDTVRLFHNVKDSVGDIRIVHVHDTVFHERERLIVLNAQGDTIKDKEWNNATQHTHESDFSHHKESHDESFLLMISKMDSLLKVLNSNQKETKVVGKSVKWWEYAIYIGIVLTLCVAVLKVKSKRLFSD